MSAVSPHLNWRSINHPVEQQRLVNGTCEIKLKEKVQRKGQLFGRSHRINAQQNLQERLF